MVWYEATEKIEELCRRERYSEAVKVAKEVLRKAEFLFGERSPYVGLQLGKLAELLACLLDQKLNHKRENNEKFVVPVNR